MKKLFFFLLTILIGIHLFAYGSILFYRAFYPHKTVFMQWRMWQTKSQAALQYQPIPYHSIPDRFKRAVIASEDARFAQHDGFDWEGIQAALRKNERKGTIKAGGSTISQQLAKNLLLTPHRNFLRKGEETVITSILESTTNKDRILDLYLNVIEWGDGIYGVESAAQYYFRHSANHLSNQEAARLASMINRPTFYQTHPQSKALRHKQNIIQRRMKKATLPD